jgi:branched-chain amino acid aminotransferase
VGTREAQTVSEEGSAGAPDLSAGVGYVDGEFVPIADVRVPILDLGFLRSDATYDVVAVWKGKFFRLDEHLERFFWGAEKLRLSLPVDREGLTRVLAECVRRGGLENAYVEAVVTRGVPPPGSRDIRRCANRMYCFAIPYVWLPTAEQRERGLRLIIGGTERISNRAVDPRIKNYHWLDFEQALLSAYDAGGDNVVLSDGHGLVTEGAGFNVFSVHDGVLKTPATNVLEGITRLTVLDIARTLGIPAEVCEVTVDELRNADEAFGATTAGGVFFVTSVDGRPLRDGAIGPLTKRIYDTYWAWHEDPRFTRAVADVPPFTG